ncbi:MAG: TerB N-terminal domain-containing protein [Synergistaceae bacterium]|jgi:hypothetical protein|nr:TerB N-terminal domain-containing protein [Synergistaceae bacterium]
MSGPSLEVVGLEVSGSEATSSPGLLWLGGEAVLRLGDVVVEAPMTYGSVGSVDVKEASCIYTRMTVNMEENASGLEMGYWPSYSAMKPHQRGYYLHWLASGKKTPPANIGYAFVYFYGLERRALLDGRDVFWILEEAKRLLELCGASRSFRGYLGRFLVYLHAKHLNDPRMTEKSLADLYRLLPASQGNMLSRLVLGHRALQNAPLSAEQAFNLLSRLPKTEKTRSFAPRFSSSPELKRLFALRYGRVYPQGFTLSASFGQKRKKNSASYSVASGTLSFAQGAKSPEPAAIPNVLGKASQFKKLQGIYDVCIEELAASKGRSASDEFVVARPAGKRLPGEPLPLVRIDMDKVAALKEETETLTRELAAVFDSGEPDEPGFTQTSSPSEDAEEETEVLPFPQEVVRQLDRRYRPCVSALLRQAAWRKEDLSALARRHSLMPNSMLDAVNTWSAETLGDFLLLEEEGAWTVNATVL